MTDSDHSIQATAEQTRTYLRNQAVRQTWPRLDECADVIDALLEQLEAAETTLAHALDFIEHQDMNYRWAEWCEGRNPSTPASREPS